MQRMTPMLAYDDATAAIAFLCDAFGFAERFRYEMPDGSIGHAEVGIDDEVVAVATTWKIAGMASPQSLAGVHGQVYCSVDDVDAHYARAREAGAIIIAAPEDQDHGARTYRALDPEGHRWIFAGPLAGAGS